MGGRRGEREERTMLVSLTNIFYIGQERSAIITSIYL